MLHFIFIYYMLLIRSSWICFGCTMVTVTLQMTDCVALARDLRLLMLCTSGVTLIV